MHGHGAKSAVTFEVTRRSRPAWLFEADSGFRLRVSLDGKPWLWSRIHTWWDEALLVEDYPAVHRTVLPPILQDHLRAAPPPADVDAWADHWTQRVAAWLTERPAGPLHNGLWCATAVPFAASPKLLSSYDEEPIDVTARGLPSLQRVTAAMRKTIRHDDWTRMSEGEVLSLRDPKVADAGRLKMWRKRARDGELVPIVVWLLPLLQKYVVIDGHVRLHAALEEGTTPTAIVVTSAREVGSGLSEEELLALPESVLRTFDSESNEHILAPMGRAWRMAGGAKAWRAELTAKTLGTPFADDEDLEWAFE